MHHHHHHQQSHKKQEATMDRDFWASKIHSSKHFSTHLSSGNRLVLDDDTELNDDSRTYFTCPFCFVDIELCKLCDHLQGEHYFDVKNAVCPVCALNLGKDVIGHFKNHHMSGIKTRRKPQKSGFWNFYGGRMLGGLNTKSGIENVDAFAPDPLLSPFFISTPRPECRDNQLLNSCSIDLSLIPETESSKCPTLSQIEEKENSEELNQRAKFCQQLIFSTIV